MKKELWDSMKKPKSGKENNGWKFPGKMPDPAPSLKKPGRRARRRSRGKS